MNIGQSIRKIRKDKKLTLKQVGNKLGMSEQAIGQYERGERQVAAGMLNKIADALDVPVSKLLEDDTINLTNSENANTYIDLVIGMPELIPLVNIFKNNGYELNQEIKGGDIFLIKGGKAIAQIPEKDFIEDGKKMLDFINEFTDFEFSKLLDTFTFLY
ncbi:helix-turn-helix domain-containing protein [Clostridium cadaveris]|uniref:helix-turn-helix domain-containing protein n=1 Tax=Clostridium cadaveris TaxID=1529 RepID=UPI001E284B99|nr:helix-turn-helix transcriptional regulator [Clostridium cadaveris]UFH66256.1 helix-turn-helix domain-containing protein [Clostridium cadaveris]